MARPKFIVDGSGRKKAVILSIEDYTRLFAAWEGKADSVDFADAEKTCKKTIPVDSLRQQVFDEERQ